MHHCKNSENYGFHVLQIGNIDFCIGCLANTIFLSFLLPIYILTIKSEMNPFVWALILGYVVFQFWRVGTSVALGRNPESLTSLLFTTIYLIVVHWTIIFGHIRIEIPETTLLLMIMILSLPPHRSLNFLAQSYWSGSASFMGTFSHCFTFVKTRLWGQQQSLLGLEYLCCCEQWP